MEQSYDFPLFGCMAIIGSRGSGKTVLLINMLKSKLLQRYDIVHWISPTCLCPDQQELLSPLHLPQDSFHEEMEPTFLQDVIEKNKVDKKRILLIMDDLACSTVGKTSWKHNSDVNRLAALGRHFHLGVIMLVQYTCNLSKPVRGNCDAFITFRIDDLDEVKILYKEGGASIVRRDFQAFVRLLDYATDEPHSYLVIDKRKRRAYKNDHWIPII